METIFPISQISLPLGAVFPSLGNIFQTNPLLQPVATDFLFSGNDMLSFTFFRNHHCNSYFCQRKPFSSFFFQILIRMEVAFRSSEIAFFKESFILTCGNGCSINYKLCAFIWIFFLLVDTILEIWSKPIFFDFFYS